MRKKQSKNEQISIKNGADDSSTERVRWVIRAASAPSTALTVPLPAPSNEGRAEYKTGALRRGAAFYGRRFRQSQSLLWRSHPAAADGAPRRPPPPSFCLCATLRSARIEPKHEPMKRPDENETDRGPLRNRWETVGSNNCALPWL